MSKSFSVHPWIKNILAKYFNLHFIRNRSKKRRKKGLSEWNSEINPPKAEQASLFFGPIKINHTITATVKDNKLWGKAQTVEDVIFTKKYAITVYLTILLWVGNDIYIHSSCIGHPEEQYRYQLCTCSPSASIFVEHLDRNSTNCSTSIKALHHTRSNGSNPQYKVSHAKWHLWFGHILTKSQYFTVFFFALCMKYCV